MAKTETEFQYLQEIVLMLLHRVHYDNLYSDDYVFVDRIAEKISVAKRRTEDVLSSLEQEGKVRKEKDGLRTKYKITEEGIKSIDDVLEEKKKILMKLHRVHYDELNQDDIPVELSYIANSVGIDKNRTKDILNILEDEKLVEKIEIGTREFFRITGKGIEHIESPG